MIGALHAAATVLPSEAQVNAPLGGALETGSRQLLHPLEGCWI
jgi:hypothetical protein